MKNLPHNWTDAHCHLADPRLESDLERALEDARKLGICRWIQGGVEPKDWERQKKLKAKYGAEIITSFGCHPWWVSQTSDEAVQSALDKLENEKQMDAIGELGIDLM